MKKWFSSLLLGFGATLAVMVALAMPPGGWGVAVGVMLGLLGCVPLLLITLLVLSRNNARQANAEPQQPVIIFQPVPQTGYEMYGTPQQGYGYMEAPQAPPQQYYFEPNYAEPQPAPRRFYRQPRQPAPTYLPEADYYEQPAEEFEPYYPAASYYDPRQPQYDPNEAYYGQPQPPYGYAEPQPAPRPRPVRRAARPANNFPYAAGRRSQNDSIVEADYRTIGD